MASFGNDSHYWYGGGMGRHTPSSRRSRSRHALSHVGVPLIVATLLGACGSEPTTTVDTSAIESTSSSVSPADTVSVAVAFYPIEEIVDRVGGERVSLVRLVEPGDNAHDAELTAKTVESLGTADVVFYISGGFQPSVEKAVDALPASVRVIDLFEAEGISHIGPDENREGTTDDTTDDDHDHAHGDEDPHVWLDPANMATMARAVAVVLAELDPTGSATFATNADTYSAEIDDLGATLEQRLSRCSTRTLVTAHDAFGYLARRAGLETVAVAGLNPEDEPSARQLEAIAEAATDAGVKTVFFEVSLPEDLARTIAGSIGAGVDTLDALEGVTKDTVEAGGSYSSIMRGNIDRIASALGCS